MSWISLVVVLLVVLGFSIYYSHPKGRDVFKKVSSYNVGVEDGYKHSQQDIESLQACIRHYKESEEASIREINHLKSALRVYEENVQPKIESCKKIAPIGTNFDYLENPAVIIGYGTDVVRASIMRDSLDNTYARVHIQYSVQTAKGTEVITQSLPVEFVKSINKD